MGRPEPVGAGVQAVGDRHAAAYAGRVSSRWTSTDAWVFAAIAHDPDPGAQTLVRVLTIADGMNHSIPSEEECTTSAGRRRRAGLIGADADADRYWVTDAGRDVRRRWRHGLFGWIEAIPPALRRQDAPEDAPWPLPEGVYEAAVRQYHAAWHRPARRPTHKQE